MPLTLTSVLHFPLALCSAAQYNRRYRGLTLGVTLTSLFGELDILLVFKELTVSLVKFGLIKN